MAAEAVVGVLRRGRGRGMQGGEEVGRWAVIIDEHACGKGGERHESLMCSRRERRVIGFMHWALQ